LGNKEIELARIFFSGNISQMKNAVPPKLEIYRGTYLGGLFIHI